MPRKKATANLYIAISRIFQQSTFLFIILFRSKFCSKVKKNHFAWIDSECFVFMLCFSFLNLFGFGISDLKDTFQPLFISNLGKESSKGKKTREKSSGNLVVRYQQDLKNLLYSKEYLIQYEKTFSLHDLALHSAHISLWIGPKNEVWKVGLPVRIPHRCPPPRLK